MIITTLIITLIIITAIVTYPIHYEGEGWVAADIPVSTWVWSADTAYSANCYINNKFAKARGEFSR